MAGTGTSTLETEGRRTPSLPKPPGWAAPLAAGLRRSPELVPGVLAVGVFIAWAAAEGGFEPTSSNPGALFLLGLLGAFALAVRGVPAPPSRRQLAAVAALAAFAAWAFLSILWADDQGIAWDGSNRALLYAIVVALFAIPAWSSASAAKVMGLYSMAVAVVGAGFFLAATAAHDPSLHFLHGRFAEPTGYHNASVALFTGAFWPALFLSSRRETPWLARGLLLGAAGLLLELSLIPQSRGWSIVFPIAALLYLGLVPGRMRTVVMALPLAIVTALWSGPLLDLLVGAEDPATISAALDDAAAAMLTSVALLVLYGGLIGILDRSIRISPRILRQARLVVGAGASVLILAGAIVALAAIGNPLSWAGDQWEDFTSGQAELSSETRFGESLGSNRYDFWQTAANQFANSPVGGAGIDNFAADYLRERDTFEEPLDPHSLPLKLLGQTGLVGTLLFASSLALILYGLVRAWRSPPDPLGRGVAAVAAVTGAYWFLHSAGDWFWAMPAVTAPPLAWLAMAARLGAGTSAGGQRRWAAAGRNGLGRLAASARARPRLLAVPATFVVAFAVATYVLPWAAARDMEEARRVWPGDPAAAFERLDRARELNFLSAEPDLAAGAISARLGDRDRMRTSFERALARDPRNWYARLELGALAALQGRRAAALEELREAQRLNPRDPTIRLVLRRAQGRRPLSLAAISEELAARICDRLGRTQGTGRCPG
jgi:hypothetical protein